MDSTKIAIHFMKRNDHDIGQNTDDIDNQNKLCFALSQPASRHRFGGPSLSPALGGRGMIANNALNRPGYERPLVHDNNIESPNRNLSSRGSATSKSRLESLGTHKSAQMGSLTPMKRLRRSGWYYGSISPAFSAKLLENEEDGSFLVRDSSSECYIFSMTLKLDGEIHHARIEHSKGEFSFGNSKPKFKCVSIVDFIEQAIMKSRSGNLDFFLHRDPELQGPVRFIMRPLLRMNGSKSLKHLCRFAILPYVRRDKINELCIPECLKDYLNEPFIRDSDID